MNNKKLIVLGLVVLLLVAVGWFGYKRYIDYKKFNDLSKQLDSFANQIRILNINNFKKVQYCDYGNQKFSEGTLVCLEYASFYAVNDDNISNIIQKSIDRLGWSYVGNNTSSLGSGTDHVYKKSLIYKKEKLSCNYIIEDLKDKYKYSVGCSGSAKAEYYPVKE